MGLSEERCCAGKIQKAPGSAPDARPLPGEKFFNGKREGRI